MFSVFVRLKIRYVMISANDPRATLSRRSSLREMSTGLYMSHADLEGIHGIKDPWKLQAVEATKNSPRCHLG